MAISVHSKYPGLEVGPPAPITQKQWEDQGTALVLLNHDGEPNLVSSHPWHGSFHGTSGTRQFRKATLSATFKLFAVGLERGRHSKGSLWGFILGSRSQC